MAFTDRADEVLAKLRAELARPISCRSSGAPDAQLQFVLQKVEQMRNEVATGNLPPRRFRHGELGRAILDGWALGSPVGTSVVDLEKEYLAL